MFLLSPLVTFLFPLILLCATAPVGATLLGWIAVTRIRRSEGALYGMPFAVFGGLLFPLLALDYVLAYALFSFAEGFLGWTEDYDPAQHAQFAFAVCVFWTLADALIVRAVWRAVNRGRKGAVGNGGPREGTVHLWPAVVLHSVLFVLVYGLFFVGMVKYGAIRRDMGFHDVAGPLTPTTELLLAAVALVFGLVLAGDIAVCFLLRRTKGRRALFWWSGAVMAGLLLFAAVSGAGFWMGLRPVIEKITRVPSALRLRSAAGPPFAGRLAHGTVELLALAPNPSANEPAWYPNGLPFGQPFPSLNGTDTAAGKSVREIAFRVKGEGESPSYPLLRFEPGSGVTGMGSSDTWNDSKQTALTFVQAIACPPDAREANVKVGVAEGAWETVFHIRKPTETSPVAGGQTSVKEGVAQGAWERGFHIGKPVETSLVAGGQKSGSDGVWEAGVEMIHGKNGDIALAFHYTVSQEFESRVAFVKADGSVSPLRGDGSQGIGGLMNSIAMLPPAEYAQIQEFQLQRRPYQWVEFRHISLQPGKGPPLEIADAAQAGEGSAQGKGHAAQIGAAGSASPVQSSPPDANLPTTPPPATPALLAERPQLRFLAWQDQWKTNHPDKPEGAFHADGSPVIDPAEVRLLGIVQPTACDHGGSGTNPRFVYLWFSHPLFDDQSLIDVTMLDAGGRAIPPGAEGMMASGGRVADQIDDHLGWLTYSFSPGTASSPVAIRLRYAIGPGERLRQFSPDEQGIVALGKGSQFNGIGQDSTGKSFFAIAVDMKQDSSRQFGVTAVTKDGRAWPSIGGSRGGGIGEAVAVQRFVFAPPLSEIAHFQLGSRPIRTVNFENVILPGKPLLASHTGLPFVAPAGSGPQASAQAAWGAPVQGVECQLRAFNGGKYQSGLPPGFVAAVRNVGKQDWLAACAQQLCEIELDGMGYSWIGASDIDWKALPPGRDYEDIPISLTREWLSADKHWLELRPGKHVLRAAFEAMPPPKTPGTPVRCVSNPVEFEIVDTDSWESPNHPSPAPMENSVR